ncbi:MAG: ribosome maturation factor RimM [Bacteroidota bacterium]|nr:ribosome maturation factor RimM [Bacteroidota bacterium]
MLERENFINIGTIIKTHGFKGLIKVDFILEFDKTEDEDNFLFILINNKVVPFYIENLEKIGNDITLIKLEDIDTKEEVQQYVGMDVCIQKEKVNIDEKQLANSLGIINYSIIDQDNKKIGLINDVFDNAGQTLFQVLDGEKEILIPFHEDLLIDLDADSQTISLQIADGLIE